MTSSVAKQKIKRHLDNPKPESSANALGGSKMVFKRRNFACFFEEKSDLPLKFHLLS
jgi:hypothetical protein